MQDKQKDMLDKRTKVIVSFYIKLVSIIVLLRASIHFFYELGDNVLDYMVYNYGFAFSTMGLSVWFTFTIITSSYFNGQASIISKKHYQILTGVALLTWILYISKIISMISE